MLIYVVANLAVFAIIGAIEERNNGVTDIEAYNGLYTTNPKLSFIMTLALFSLGGIPPFAGMFSKFFVFMSAVEQGSTLSYVIVFIALINTVVSLYYYLLIVKAMYINKNENPCQHSSQMLTQRSHLYFAPSVCCCSVYALVSSNTSQLM